MSAGWKVLTHDYRSPIQGGEPVWNGQTLPFALPAVTHDTSDDECAAGWNYTADLATAFHIGGLWPTGYPSTAFLVEPSADWIERGNKRRCSQLTLLRRASDGEIGSAISDLSQPFRGQREQMADSQMQWREALARPLRDERQAESELRMALEARGLRWSLQRYDSARDAWDAYGGWGAWDAWDARDPRAARAAWDARDALTVEYAGLAGWIKSDPLLLTTGIRNAYRHGLATAVPTAPDTLGWAMVEA